MEIEKRVQIQCKANELWEWVTEFDKIKKWNTSILKEVLISKGEIRKGFLSKILIKEGNKDIWYENEILEYQPLNYLKISLKGSSLGKSPMIVEYRISLQNAKLILIYRASWKPVGILLKLLYPFIKKISIKNIETTLSELKRQVEKNTIANTGNRCASP